MACINSYFTFFIASLCLVFASNLRDKRSPWYPQPSNTVNQPISFPQPNTNNFGQNTFGQNTFGQNTFGQNTFGQNTFGQNAFGQNTFGQNTLGQNTFGQNTFGQNIFGQNNFQRPLPSLPTPSIVQSPWDQGYRRCNPQGGEASRPFIVGDSHAQCVTDQDCWDQDRVDKIRTFGYAYFSDAVRCKSGSCCLLSSCPVLTTAEKEMVNNRTKECSQTNRCSPGYRCVQLEGWNINVCCGGNAYCQTDDQCKFIDSEFVCGSGMCGLPCTTNQQCARFGPSYRCEMNTCRKPRS